VEEETQAPTTTAMEIDSHNGAQGHKTNDTGNLQQPARAEEAQRTNGEANVHTEVVVPRPHPEAGSAQQQEGLVEYLNWASRLGRRAQTSGGWDL
jgi:hypothetical protein